MSGSSTDDGCNALFLIAILRSCGVRVIIRILSFSCFYSRLC